MYCCGRLEERGGSAIGASCSVRSQTAGHHLHDLQRWARTVAVISDTRGGRWLPPLPPSVLCVSASHCPHLPRSLHSPPLLRVPWSGANFPGRMQGTPQAVATSHQPLPLQALPTHPNCDCCIPPSPPLAWESKWALISYCLHHFLPGQGTDTWGWPTDRGRVKTKAELQGLWDQREISLCSQRSNRLNPCNWLGKACICEIYE